MRIALLTNILTPYRLPVYRTLASTPDWKLRVFVNALHEPNRSWQVDADELDVEVVAGWSFRRRFATHRRARSGQWVTAHIPIALPTALWRFAPDVVVSAELGARTSIAILYCWLTNTPLVIWSYHSEASAAASSRFQRWLRRRMLATARSVIGMGSQARAVLETHGVPPSRIFDAPNAHDSDGCERALERVDADASLRALTAEHGCRDRVALVVGRLVPAKGIAELLHGWSALPAGLRAEWSLLFLGSGPLEPDVHRTRDLRAPGEIVHVDDVEPDEVVAFYAAAQLLIFPSLGDPWGLVVNEALACGVPVVCSSLAGCADELVRPGENGWIVDPTRPGDLERTLFEALTSHSLDRLATGAREAAARFHPDVMADGMRRAILHAADPSAAN